MQRLQFFIQCEFSVVVFSLISYTQYSFSHVCELTNSCQKHTSKTINNRSLKSTAHFKLHTRYSVNFAHARSYARPATLSLTDCINSNPSDDLEPIAEINLP